MKCIFCKSEMPRASSNIKAALCGRCVVRLAGNSAIPVVQKKSPTDAPKKRGRPRKNPARTPQEPRKNPVKTSKGSGRGRGWHLRKKFEWEGKFYSFGKEITEVEYATL